MLKLMASTAVVAMAVALSFSRNLDLQAEMIFATARSFLQLSLVGFVFHFIFSQKTAPWILLPNLFMVLVAGHTAGHRARLVPYGKWIAAASILVGTWATVSLPIALKIVPFSPRYIVPVAGMMVGHAMAVTGVAMKQLHEDVYQRNLVKTARAGLRPTIASASGSRLEGPKRK